MRRIIMFALLALTMLGGVAAATPHDYRGGGGYVQRPRNDHRHYQDRHLYSPRTYYRPTHYSRPAYRYVRRPIYVQRPAIGYRYFNYYRRPALIVENYPPIEGYYWVPGRWDWSGYEWMWTPGYYEPGYSNGYRY